MTIIILLLAGCIVAQQVQVYLHNKIHHNEAEMVKLREELERLRVELETVRRGLP